MQRRVDQPPGGAQDVEIDRVPTLERGGRRHLAAADIADHRDGDHRDRRCLHGDDAGEQGPAQDRDIGAGFDQAGAAEHFVLSRCCGRIAYLIGPKKVE